MPPMPPPPEGMPPLLIAIFLTIFVTNVTFFAKPACPMTQKTPKGGNKMPRTRKTADQLKKEAERLEAQIALEEAKKRLK